MMAGPTVGSVIPESEGCVACPCWSTRRGAESVGHALVGGQTKAASRPRRTVTPVRLPSVLGGSWGRRSYARASGVVILSRALENGFFVTTVTTTPDSPALLGDDYELGRRRAAHRAHPHRAPPPCGDTPSTVTVSSTGLLLRCVLARPYSVVDARGSSVVSRFVPRVVPQASLPSSMLPAAAAVTASGPRELARRISSRRISSRRPC